MKRLYFLIALPWLAPLILAACLFRQLDAARFDLERARVQAAADSSYARGVLAARVAPFEEWCVDGMGCLTGQEVNELVQTELTLRQIRADFAEKDRKAD